MAWISVCLLDFCEFASVFGFGLQFGLMVVVFGVSLLCWVLTWVCVFCIMGLVVI